MPRLKQAAARFLVELGNGDKFIMFLPFMASAAGPENFRFPRETGTTKGRLS